MNHFKPIPHAEDSLGPTRSRDDRSIVFHSDTVALKPEFGDKLIEAGRLRKRSKAAGLAVQNYRERHDVSSLAGVPVALHWTPHAHYQTHNPGIHGLQPRASLFAIHPADFFLVKPLKNL
jgi:hypothetical protein